MRAASRVLRAAPWAASAASAACSALPTAAWALSTAAASAARSGRLSEAAALGLRPRGFGELISPRREIGERPGQFAEGLFRGADDSIGLGGAGIDAGAALGARPHFVAERLFFLGKLRELAFGKRFDVRRRIDFGEMGVGHWVKRGAVGSGQ